ncbi:carbamoyl-phosphate synthase small subunit [Humitalea rosea]|uniref:Carbamoyl phosphate synthase small chain n=1 Tax=Humitalea rosea TaxID=990373 RepID=A0A2W7I509_9PROT|nr:glutamine-hydrolyzing carbamoyl-phosphate synthase small subunit [Humitalea rosea]PZW41328.1 carbamoyl-phosphate synthase small subunit [Humitalea rosea]
MTSVEDIISRLGGPEAAAARCKVGTEAIRKWRQSRAIPPKHWPVVLEATGLTLADMPRPAETTAPAQPATKDSSMPPSPPAGATAALVLADGTVFWGRGFGAHATTVAEICFNTAMTGYQEVLTDPSYAGQSICFTFPHIGNTGCNADDLEAVTPAARGLIVKADPTAPASWRATLDLRDWLVRYGIPGIAGIDTRALTIRIRDGGPPTGVIHFPADGKFDLAALTAKAAAWPGLEGMDLAREVTCRQAYGWTEGAWDWATNTYPTQTAPRFRVVAMDYGAKLNILRCLAAAGCEVMVLPATATGEEILARKPDGVFLSNGPGDPAATGVYAVPAIKAVLAAGVPVFGICLGHQLLALALGAKTYKLALGHRGANQPVKELATGRVEITSQNHGFAVDANSLPAGVRVTHTSLFDGSNEGIASDSLPAFSVQYHPEASPGPTDSHHLFGRFVDMMQAKA